MNGGSLVTNVDDADAELGAMVPDRLNMAALQAEHAVYPSRLEEAGDPGADGILVGSKIIDRLTHSEVHSARQL